MMGKNCVSALEGAEYDVIGIDAGDDVVEQLVAARADVAFNALMGRWGEDGAIQGLLEWLQIPYTHSGVNASAICMNKAASRAVYQANGLPVAKGHLIHRDRLIDGHPLDPPYVLKPNLEGSSIGIQFIWDKATPAPTPGPDMPEIVLVEELVPGVDLTVGVLRDRGFGVTQIETESGVWDYQSKYSQPHARYMTPAALPPDITARCLELGEAAHHALGCRFISRTDLRWDESKGLDGFTVIETNTQPAIGFEGGTFDSQLAAKNLTLSELCHLLVQDASLRR